VRALGTVLLSVGLGACSSAEEPEFTYDKADMEGVIVGTWTGTWTPDGSSASELTLELRPAPSGSLRPACNSRVLSSGSPPGLHPTCAASSALRLVGNLSVADGSVAEPSLVGELSIWSLNLGPGELSLTNADDTFRLYAQQNEQGGFESCGATAGDRQVTCALDSRR